MQYADRFLHKTDILRQNMLSKMSKCENNRAETTAGLHDWGRGEILLYRIIGFKLEVST